MDTIKRIIDEHDRSRLQAWVIGLVREVRELRLKVRQLERYRDFLLIEAHDDVEIIERTERLADLRLILALMFAIMSIILTVLAVL